MLCVGLNWHPCTFNNDWISHLELSTLSILKKPDTLSTVDVECLLKVVGKSWIDRICSAYPKITSCERRVFLTSLEPWSSKILSLSFYAKEAFLALGVDSDKDTCMVYAACYSVYLAPFYI